MIFLWYDENGNPYFNSDLMDEDNPLADDYMIWNEGVFLHDLKVCKKRGYDIDKLWNVIGKLQNGEPLPASCGLPIDCRTFYNYQMAIGDLLMQILYNGSLVEVLEPQDLRDAVAEQAFRMADIYSVE